MTKNLRGGGSILFDHFAIFAAAIIDNAALKFSSQAIVPHHVGIKKLAHSSKKKKNHEFCRFFTK